MRMWIGTIVAAFIAMSCTEAAAQSWSADAVAQQCTSEGAFGQTFGARRANGRTGRSAQQFAEFDRTVTPPTTYEPFDHFEVKFSPLSHVIVQVTAFVTFGNEAEAVSAYADLVAAYERGGRFGFQSEDAILRDGAPEGIVFKTEAEDAALSAMVARSGRTLYVLCSHGRLTTQAFQEAFEQFDRRHRQ